MYSGAGSSCAARRGNRGQGEAHLSAEQPPARAGAWFPFAYADAGRPGDRVGTSPQGSSSSDCLIDEITAVLPAQYRMTRAAEFDATVRHGVRAAQPDVVVHARRSSDGNESDVSPEGPSAESGPWIGLVVAKSVGTAVQRHRVSRRLRHVSRSLLTELEPGERVVIRALPGSRHAISSRLEQELRTALRRAHELMERRR